MDNIKYHNLDKVYEFCKKELNYRKVYKSYSRTFVKLHVYDCSEEDATKIISQYKPIIRACIKCPDYMEFHINKD